MPLRVLALAAAAAVLAAAAPAPKTVELYTMDCGVIHERDADEYADDGTYKGVARDLVVPCFLIRHPKGDLIWDTGLPQTFYDQPGHKAFGQFTVEHRLTDQLKRLGLAPGDVKYLSVSHSHFDHLGNGGLFAASTWIVHADERAYAFRAEQRADKNEFPRYAALETAKTIVIQGDAPYDVFGDGSAVIYPAPGHTPGHTVLLVRLKQAGPTLLTGDMWHLPESRAARRVPRFNTDRAQTLRSMDKVETLAADTGARVVREHVPEDIAALPKFPQPLR